MGKINDGKVKKVLSFFGNGTKNVHLQRNGTQERACVGDGLGHLNTPYTQSIRQKQDSGNKEQTLTGSGHESGGAGFAGNLLHHIAHDDKALEREGTALNPQSQRPAGDDFRVIPENTDQLGCKNKTQYADETEKTERTLYAEPKAFFNPVNELSTVIKSAEGLETLGKTDHGGSTELHDALYHTHGGNYHISVRTAALFRQMVERDASPCLTKEGRPPRMI